MTNCLSEINQIRLIFYPYEVVGRGSDTQLHMSKIQLNYFNISDRHQNIFLRISLASHWRRMGASCVIPFLCLN